MFDAQNMMCAADPKQGRYLAASAIFRGIMPMPELESDVMNYCNNNSSQLWIPKNIKISKCDIPQRSKRMAVISIGNSTAI